MSHKTGAFQVSKFYSYLNVLEQFGIIFWSLMILITKKEKIMVVSFIRLTKNIMLICSAILGKGEDDLPFESLRLTIVITEHQLIQLQLLFKN